MDKQHENPLGVEPINHLMARFAIPSIIAMLVSALYNMVDQFFIGHSVGMQGNAATNVAFPLTITCTAVSLLFGIGGAANFNLSMGRKKPEEAKHFIGNAIFLMLSFGITLCLLVFLFLDPLLKLFGATADILTYSRTYTSITAFGFPFVILATGGSNLVRADGSPNFSMACTLIGCLINLVLDPLFIFGLGMGVKGAALATIISQAVSCGWVLAFLTGKKTFLRIKKEYLKPVPSIVFPCLALGLSTFVMQSSESVISVCFNSSLLKYGGDLAVGAMTILTSTMQFAMLPLQGIGQGAQPIMSYNYGARNIDRMKKTFKLHLVISLIYSTLFWLFVQLFPATFAGIFSSDPELVSFTAGALRIYCGAMFLFGIQLACQMTFVAIGYAVCSIIVAVVRKFVLLLPLIFIVPRFVSNKTMGVYMAEPIADAIAVTFTAILFSIQFKKALKKLDKA